MQPVLVELRFSLSKDLVPSQDETCVKFFVSRNPAHRSFSFQYTKWYGRNVLSKDDFLWSELDKLRENIAKILKGNRYWKFAEKKFYCTASFSIIRFYNSINNSYLKRIISSVVVV